MLIVSFKEHTGRESLSGSVTPSYFLTSPQYRSRQASRPLGREGGGCVRRQQQYCPVNLKTREQKELLG